MIRRRARAALAALVAVSVLVLVCCSSNVECTCTAERAGASQTIACGQSACVGGELVTCNDNAIGFGGPCPDAGD